MARFETLLYEEEEGVARITLNRPEVHNAFNTQMQRELRDLWRGLRRNDDVRVVVLTGAGDKAFCTGIDRTETMSNYGSDEKPEQRAGSGSTPFIVDNPGANVGPKSCDLWKPVIAAVNGVVCGGGFYMLGEAEFIIAAESATFFDPHVTYGMTSAFEPIHMLQKMPFHEVMRMSLLGNRERLPQHPAVGEHREVGALLVVDAGPAPPTPAQEGALQRLLDQEILVVEAKLQRLATPRMDHRGSRNQGLGRPRPRSPDDGISRGNREQ